MVISLINVREIRNYPIRSRLLSWYPAISSHWPHMTSIWCSLAESEYSKYLIIPFWYASVAYQVRLVSLYFSSTASRQNTSHGSSKFARYAAEAYQKDTISYLITRLRRLATVSSRATLNFRKFKVALNPLDRMFSNFAKSYILSCLS